MAKRSPEEQVEFARRRDFFRSRQGRWLVIGAALGVFVWLFAAAIVLPPLSGR